MVQKKKIQIEAIIFFNKIRLLFTYIGPSSLKLEAKESGGVGEWVNILKDDQIEYVFFRLYDEFDLQNIKQLQTIDVLMTWVGHKVGLIERGKKKGNTPDVSKFLQVCGFFF